MSLQGWLIAGLILDGVIDRLRVLRLRRRVERLERSVQAQQMELLRG